MSCFSCIPPPASLKPRKIYNVLVPDVFPLIAPDSDAPITRSINRKIEKLHEYIDRSPDKIPKVSRRLSRRIKRSLADKQVGFVRIAVHAYIYLLDKSVEEDSVYSVSYFSKELIHQPDAAISCLINHLQPDVQALGTELLASYIRAQDACENQVEAVDQLMGSVVSLMLGRSIKVPGGPATASRAAPMSAASKGVKAGCMSSIQEYIMLCHKLKIVPALLLEATECILSNIDMSSTVIQTVLSQPLGSPVASGDAARAVAGSTPGGDAPSSASEVALSALQSFRPFLQETGVVTRVLEVVLRHLDMGGKWEEEQYVKSLLGLIKHASGDHTFPLFTALMRHSSAEGLTPRQRKIVIGHAIPWGTAFSLSALSLALTELPKSMVAAGVAPGGGGNPEQEELRQQALSAMQELASEVGDAAQLCDAAAGALRHHTVTVGPQPMEPWALQCCLAALKAIPEFKEQGRTFPERGFPGLLVQYLGHFLVGPGQPSAADAERRPLALRALQAVLDVVSSGGAPAPDERAALRMLSTVCSLALPSGAEPRELAGAACLMAAVATSRKAYVLLQLARLLLAVRAACFQAEAASWRPSRLAAGLLLTDCLLLQLAVSAQCPALSQLQVPGKALEQSVGELRVSRRGPAQRQMTILVASADQFADSADSKGKAKAGVAAAQAVKGTPSSWSSAVVETLKAEGVLSSECGPSLPALLTEPLDTAALMSGGKAMPFSAPSASLPGGGLGVKTKDEAPSLALKQLPRSLMGQVQNLPDLVHGASWGIRQPSFMGRKVNLEHVLELLEQKDDGGEAPLKVAGARAVLSPVASKELQVSEPPNLSVKEVLDMVAKARQVGRRAHDPAGGSLMHVDLHGLARQLQPWVV